MNRGTQNPKSVFQGLSHLSPRCKEPRRFQRDDMANQEGICVVFFWLVEPNKMIFPI